MEAKFRKGDKVEYLIKKPHTFDGSSTEEKWVDAQIVSVHFDDPPTPYYTIGFQKTKEPCATNSQNQQVEVDEKEGIRKVEDDITPTTQVSPAKDGNKSATKVSPVKKNSFFRSLKCRFKRGPTDTTKPTDTSKPTPVPTASGVTQREEQEKAPLEPLSHTEAQHPDRCNKSSVVYTEKQTTEDRLRMKGTTM